MTMAMKLETKFNINFSQMVELLLPFSMRSASILALMRSAFAPLHDLYRCFESARNNDRFIMRHNGQVCYLRAALNEKFKSSIGLRFDIVESYGNAEWVYIGRDSELPFTDITDERPGKDCFFIPDETVLDITNTFVVCVPTDLYDKELQAIERFVNQYRLITKIPLYKPKNN